MSLSFVLLGGHVCTAAGQCHLPAYGARDQCNDDRGCHPRCDFTSQVSPGNENAIYIWTTRILLRELSICLCSCILGVRFTK